MSSDLTTSRKHSDTVLVNQLLSRVSECESYLSHFSNFSFIHDTLFRDKVISKIFHITSELRILSGILANLS
jgi:uncharacterized protein with HEPN domain